MAKKPVSFRLTDSARQQLEDLLDVYDDNFPELEIDKTKLVQLAIARLHKEIVTDQKDF